ncbi:hypothetical protein NMY22_g19811 [Coprinellus aureogranulatus]|nr:hypothetical protein NMY22_g19811 [Coprinellus aureogranulatus]
MGKTWAVDSIVKGNFLSIYFVPPSAASRHPTSDLNLCPLRVEADYDSTCALADLMYSRLPEDWAERYGEQLDSGRNPSDILRHEIDRVISELGVDIEDRVILSAGAQRYELL